MEFLGTVPLFRHHVSRSDLPGIAMKLKMKAWLPGQDVQLESPGEGFLLIMSGSALATMNSSRDQSIVETVLRPGDYLNGRTFALEGLPIPQVVAQGPTQLLTLSMSETDLESVLPLTALRFHHELHFMKPGMYSDRIQCWQQSFDAQLKDLEEQLFIQAALRRNANLRALCQAEPKVLRSLAEAGERVLVPRGTVVTRCGFAGHEMFVLRSGKLDVLTEETLQHQQTADASSSMAQRLLRKQVFLRSLATTGKGHVLPCCTSESTLICSRKHMHPMQEHLEGLLCARRSWRQPRQKGMKQAQAPPLQPKCITSEPQLPTSSSLSDVDESVSLHPSDSFGELSVLYNTRREATVVAAEDSVLYVISKRHFGPLLSRQGPRVQEYCRLLEEVHALSPLLSSERLELACNATGLVEFHKNERVLTQGKVREAWKWYVIYSGSCVVSKEQVDDEGKVACEELAILGRASHFGDRSLLLREQCAEVNVDAGPDGLCCLTFDGDSVLPLLEFLFERFAGVVPSLKCDIREWIGCKARGWGKWSERPSTLGTGISLTQLKRVCHLGRGSYGLVYLVEDEKTHQRYALKTMSKGHIQQQHAQQQVCRERELLFMVQSKFIVQLECTLRDEQHVHFVLEAVVGGSLSEVLRAHSEVLFEDTPRGSSVAFYAACLIAALEHLHERRIVHRDVKPDNVLLDSRGYAKLCDMGFARFVLSKTNTLAGTPEYMAPEMIDLPHAHDMSVDWWSLGVLCFELLAGHLPFDHEGISEPLGRLLAVRRRQELRKIEFPSHVPQVARRFVSALLTKLPGRLGAMGDAPEVRRHPMFSSLAFDFDALYRQLMVSPYVPRWQLYTSSACGQDQQCNSCGCPDGREGSPWADNWDETSPRHDSLFLPFVDDGTGWDLSF